MTDAPKVRRNKWLYEEIVERVPPFKWLPPNLDVVAQLLIVEAVGIIAFLTFQMRMEAVIFGTLAIIYTVIWSAGCLYVIPWLRRLRNPTNPQELIVLSNYRNRLLSDRRYELTGSIIIFLGIVSYLILEPGILQYFLGAGFGNPILFILILVLVWDVCYRLWLSFLTTLFAACRSISLSRAAKKRRSLEYTAYSEVRTLKSLDLVNMYWAGTAVLLIPIASFTPLLLFGIIGFLGIIVGLSALSLLIMETIPWFPPDVESILYHEKFAYVSACVKGEPHTTPVIFVYDGKYLYFAVSLASAKYRLIKKNNQISVLVDMRDETDIMNNRTLLLRGKGMILGEVTPIGIVKLYLYGLWMIRVWRMFTKKYPQYTKYYKEQTNIPLAWQSKPLISRVLVRLEPEQVTYWRQAKPAALRV
ncbi:MAG: pyridoxamine 5'-phosphate oxidase family protein [Candidatus Thorarchaeota archaeon]